jgi:type I restriction enzyme R subunit
MRRDVKTDWTVRDDVRAKLRSSIRRLLISYKYPPMRSLMSAKLAAVDVTAPSWQPGHFGQA